MGEMCLASRHHFIKSSVCPVGTLAYSMGPVGEGVSCLLPVGVTVHPCALPHGPEDAVSREVLGASRVGSRDCSRLTGKTPSLLQISTGRSNGENGIPVFRVHADADADRWAQAPVRAPCLCVGGTDLVLDPEEAEE